MMEIRKQKASDLETKAKKTREELNERIDKCNFEISIKVEDQKFSGSWKGDDEKETASIGRSEKGSSENWNTIDSWGWEKRTI